ncbi:MAG TPA: tyrosine-type recombinase/integrase [Gemmatimonadota bacterium]|nr:tyrosine-type recombinase/integrase [Gemmatimonadota bacterium]
MRTSHKPDNVPSQGSRPGHALKALIHDYLEDLEINGSSALTARRYSAYLTTFVNWLAFRTTTPADALTASDVTDELLREYRLFLARRRDPRSGRPVGPGTRNLYVIVLRNLLRYCRRRRIAAPDPDETLDLAKERDIEIRHLGRDEVDRIRDAVDLSKTSGLRDRALIEVLFGTAIRVSELAGLTIRQVDLGQRAAQVVGKGGRSRLILFTEEAAAWLGRYLASRTDDHPALFVNGRRLQLRALSVRQMQRVVEQNSLRAGLPFRVSPHWFRHSRLTELAQHAGVQVAQRIAGHTSVATTSRYLHVSDPHLRDLFDRADEASRKYPK